MALVTTNRQGIWKELRKVERKQKKTSADKKKKRKLKSGIGEHIVHFIHVCL